LDPVLDLDPAFGEFRSWIRFRIQIQIWIQILDLNPYPKQAKTSFSFALPALRSFAASSGQASWAGPSQKNKASGEKNRPQTDGLQIIP
jgi:hypothetical protein